MKKLFAALVLFGAAVPAFSQHTIEIRHKYYTMEFDTTQSAELLGYYVQTVAHSTATAKTPRKGKFARFTSDPLLTGEVLANDNEYTDWNKNHADDPMDRGHINPFTAFVFSDDAALESMYYSNTCPQSKYFNEHQWEAVEQYVLKLSRGYKGAAPIDNIKVWTGVLISVSHMQKMNDVPKPDYYWKVISYVKNGQPVEEAWLGPNTVTNHNTAPSAIATTADHVKKVILQYYPKMKLDF